MGPALTGTCPHCDWQVVAGSYSELVERYHDHLRAEHPTAWLHA
jgi:predicted small metal-binding protein